MEKMNLLAIASLVLLPHFLFCQLTYTTQVTNNTNCECDYTGPKVLINQFCATPSYGNASIYGNDGQTPLDPNMWEGEWIELYNPSPCSSSDISNYIIGTTINNNALSFLIPSGTIIPPRGFAVIRGNKSPIPPSGVVDILINSNNNICSANPNDYFWLPGEGGLGGWFCLYSNQGVPLDAVEYGPQWPFNTTPPCNPPGNTLPQGTVLAPLSQIRLMPIFKDFHPGAIPPNFNSLGKTYYRTPDGGVWNNAESPEDLQPENISFGSCNISSNCLPPSYGCNGSIAMNMTSGTAPYIYNWNTTPSQNTSAITGLCAGEYCVIVTDAAGLTETICVTIIDELFDINATIQHTVCNQNNGSIVLNPEGEGPFTYTWTPNVSTTNSVNSLPSGTYQVLINNGSCDRDTTIIITPSIGVTTTLNSTEISCITNQGTVEVIPTGGVLPYTILWNNVISPALITTQAGNTYISSVTDANGCTDYDTIIPIAPIIPTTIASYQSPICEGDTLFLIASNSTVANSSYSWSGPNSFTSNLQNPFIQNADGNLDGEYIVTVSKNDCFSNDTITIHVNPKPIITAFINTPKCEGDTLHFAAISSIGNSSFSWSGPNNFTSSISNPTIDNLNLTASGTYFFSATANGCSSDTSIDVIVKPLPIITPASNSAVCFGDELKLFANDNLYNNTIFVWSGPADFISNIQNPIISNVNLTQAGKYYITTLLDGCISKDSLDVVVYPIPEALFSVDTTRGCEPLTITFTNLSNPVNSNLAWTFGDGTTSNNLTNISHTYSSPGDYDVTLITTLNTCSDTLTMDNLIHISPYAHASFLVNQPSATIDEPVFIFTNNSTNANQYTWYFGDDHVDYSIDPTHQYAPIPGYYDVMLIANNPDNCADTTIQTIQIIEPLIFYIPNTFTPDGDAHNQMFQPIFTSGFDADRYKISIYNRWGEIVYESSNTLEGWNGTYKGEMVQDGVYIWKINFKDSNNDKMYHFSGHVNLLK